MSRGLGDVYKRQVVLIPYYYIRAIGGLLYLVGFLMFAYNIYKSTSAKAILAEPKSASPMGGGAKASAEVM